MRCPAKDESNFDQGNRQTQRPQCYQQKSKLLDTICETNTLWLRAKDSELRKRGRVLVSHWKRSPTIYEAARSQAAEVSTDDDIQVPKKKKTSVPRAAVPKTPPRRQQEPRINPVGSPSTMFKARSEAQSKYFCLLLLCSALMMQSHRLNQSYLLFLTRAHYGTLQV